MTLFQEKAGDPNGKEIMTLLNNHVIPPRVPFVPVIYEHAAGLLGISTSSLARDEDLVVKGQLKAYNLYKHDLVSVGVDIYNVEAEALGCRVQYFNDMSVPSIEGPVISNYEEFSRLTVPDPRNSGRMPLFLSAAARINESIGNEVPVTGTITGPFTLAALLRGFEPFLMDLLTDEIFAREQLMFTTEVSYAYAKAFAETGVGVSINESWIAPPLLSPDVFSSSVLEFEKLLINRIRSCGVDNVALICGGNTSAIAHQLVRTGSSLLMADYNTDHFLFKKLCEKHKINLRACVDPVLVEQGNEDLMEEAVKKVMPVCSANGRFIFGCGVVSSATPPENIIFLKDLVEKQNPYR